MTMKASIELKHRREDYPLITGHGQYVDDLKVPEGRPAALHMVVVRSPYAHAKIEQIALDEARALPGVVAAFSGAELAGAMPTLTAIPVPGLKKPERHPMAIDRVRYVGDSVAVILAEDAYTASDARDLVEVDYAPLAAVSDLEAALAPDAPLLYEEFGSNVAYSQQSTWGDVEGVFAQADHITSLRLVNQRLAPSSMEPRACLFDYDEESGIFSAWLSSQFGRPVKWIETRSENLQAQTHGRGQINYVEVAYQNDGTLLGFKIRTLGDLGAFLNGMTAMVPSRTPAMVCGPYRVQAVESEVIGVFTNKIPTAPYRGAGRPEATYITERAINRVARELQLDPAEVRRRNFIAPDAFPYETVTGIIYDSGNYQAGLERALALADYEGWRARQSERRAQRDSKLLGIGLSTFTEISGDGGAMGPVRESATARIRRDGMIVVESAVAHNGQGHFTLFAQIAAEVFDIDNSQVEVRLNDAALPSFSVGTFGSRVTQVAGSAIFLAAQAAREKALQVAAQVLEAAPADLVMEDGRVLVRGVTARSVSLAELAQRAEEHPELIAHEAPNPANGAPIEGLAAWRDFAPPNSTWPSGAHVAVVEIDSETGEIHIPAYVAVDDCGRVINHTMTEGQIHGSLVQGIGQALIEEVQYGEEGQLLTSTFMDYAMPIAPQMPNFTTGLVETLSPFNPLGAKGVGESGCIGAPPAIVNAVLDALAPLGITTIDMPLKPEKVWAIIQQAREGSL